MKFSALPRVMRVRREKLSDGRWKISRFVPEFVSGCYVPASDGDIAARKTLLAGLRRNRRDCQVSLDAMAG